MFVAFGIRSVGIGAQRRWFATVVMGAGLSILLGLNIVNAEAWVAQYNLTNAPTAHTEYIADLSTDVIPTLVDNFFELPAPRRVQLEEQLCSP